MSADLSAEFILPPGLDPAAFADQMERALALRPGSASAVASVCHDSFDWRFRQAGWAFTVETINRATLVYFSRIGAGRGEPRALSKVPRFAADFPAGKWRTRAEALLDARALLPRLELKGERRLFQVEDSEGSVLVYLELECFAVREGRAARPLSPRLRVVAAKGVRKLFRQIEERLTSEFGLMPAGEARLDEALAALGQSPENPSALRHEPMDPALRADAAMKQVLADLHDIIRANEAGTLARTDTEFLHDYRVAVRRTRSALGQVRQVFPERMTRRYVQGFAALGRAAGEPRDLDVHMLNFDRMAAILSEQLRPGLEPLRAFLREWADGAHRRLGAYLESVAYRRLMTGWSEFLAAPPPRRPSAPRAARPIAEVAGRRIWKLYRRVLDEGGAIDAASPPEQLHALRKSCKKLRYLMELFRSLYPADRVGPLLKILKALQEHLGDYQDVHVQIAELRRIAGQLHDTGAPTETLLALGALLDRLLCRDQELREAFDECYGAFATEAHQRRFRQLFRPPEPPSESG